MEYKPNLLDKDLILADLKEMHQLGLKSVVYAGEGEPLVNKKTPEIINDTKRLGLDVAMSTNGVLFTKDVSDECMEALTWIRFSVSAGTSECYQKIHRGLPGDFERVLENLNHAVELKRKKNLSTTLGVQMLLIPENLGEVMELAKIMKEIGVDYFTVKPYSQHPKSFCTVDTGFDYEKFTYLEQELNELSSDSYQIFFRTKAMNKKKQSKAYSKCLGLPFFTYIDASARVWPCIAFLGDSKLCYGSLKEKSFVEIWEGKHRADIVEKFNNMDISICRELCRLDEINSYLDQLRNPGEHVNFI